MFTLAPFIQLISIRLQKSLIDKFKFIALKNGIGYQPLMKQVLTRFADAEMNRLVNEIIANDNNQKRSTLKNPHLRSRNKLDLTHVNVEQSNFASLYKTPINSGSIYTLDFQALVP